ncbi:MAG: hypothetical protein PHI18_08295 [bacterium]|nr:hypothetical protein [bacterium]
MKTATNTLIILMMAVAAGAQGWPSGAAVDPASTESGPSPGELTVQVAAAKLSSDEWSEQRTRFGLAIGLGEGFWLSAGGSARDLSGHGAFQQGLEDTRLGLGFWPALTRTLDVGASGYFIVPTGYRSQEHYYAAAEDSVHYLPPFSFQQTAGELMTGARWSLSPAAELGAMLGYLSTSDRAEQAFRWALSARLMPLGPRYAAEFGYAQSLVRTGTLPNTETVTAALALNLGWGFTLLPGVTAELGDDPLYGGSIGLRFTARLPKSVVGGKESETAPLPVFLGGRVLVAPPLCNAPLAGSEELWQSIRGEIAPSFDEVVALSSLDVPGLPYSEETRSRQDQSLRAISEASPEAEWLLIARVEHEDVTRAGGLRVPLVVNQTQWTAECRLTVELVNLYSIQTRTRRTIEATAVKREMPTLAMVSTPESELLSASAARQLTFAAYREAGREIARMVGTWESDWRSSRR